jgi:hypothetical protein
MTMTVHFADDAVVLLTMVVIVVTMTMVAADDTACLMCVHLWMRVPIPLAPRLASAVALEESRRESTPVNLSKTPQESSPNKGSDGNS